MAKLTDGGPSSSYTWVKSGNASGTLGQQPPLLAVSGANIYVAGSFYGSTLTFGTITLVGNGSTVYIAKLTDAGSTSSFAWGSQSMDQNDGFVGAVAAEGTSVYVAGRFGVGTISFGSTSLMNAGPANTTDVFVAKLTDGGNSGRFNWALRGGGTGIDNASALALVNGGLYVLGRFSGPASFGSTILSNTRGCFWAALTQPTLAMAAASPLAGLALFPNPARTAATVQLPPVPGAATATLTLLDALGRTVRTATVALPAAGLRHELDLRGLTPGLYALRVAAGTGTATRRLVVE